MSDKNEVAVLFTSFEGSRFERALRKPRAAIP